MTFMQLPPGPPPPPEDDSRNGVSGMARHTGRRRSRRPWAGRAGVNAAARVPLLTRLKLLPAVFAGCDIRVLARTPSEWTFYNVLGAAVLVVASLSGGSAMVAISYAMQVPVAHIWWIGPAWMLAMALAVERLMLQITATRSRRALAGALLFRFALVSVIGLQISEPLVLLFNRGEINNVLSTNRTNALIASERTANHIYDTRISADYRQIAVIRDQESTLAALIEHYTFLSQCEASAPGCSHTHVAGEGVWYHHYARLAAQKEAQLKAVQPQDNLEIQRLQQDIATQQADKTAVLVDRHKAIDGESGFLARMEALGTLEAHHPVVTLEGWLLRIFFWLWDLLPLTAAVLRTLAVKDSPYEALLRAERHRDGLQAKALDTSCEVEEDRITRQGRADKDVNRVRIQDNVDHAIAGRNPYEWTDGERGTYGEPIDAWDLRGFADSMTPHESRPVTVPDALRRAGIAAVLTTLGVGLGLGVWSLATGTAVAGIWLALGALGGLAALAAFTRGFRRAPAWALRAIYASLIASFALPFAVLAINYL